MKIQKLALALTFTFFVLTGITTAMSHDPLTTNECALMVQFNKTMNEKLRLTDRQLEVVLKFNKDYWSSRKNIINNPNMIGQNTALLACWDNWRITLADKLSQAQMEKFMEWQAQVDLLGEHPF